MSEMVLEMAKRAKRAARKLAGVGTRIKNAALLAMADALVSQQAVLLDANAADVAAARERGRNGQPMPPRVSFGSLVLRLIPK